MQGWDAGGKLTPAKPITKVVSRKTRLKGLDRDETPGYVAGIVKQKRSGGAKGWSKLLLDRPLAKNAEENTEKAGQKMDNI